MKLSIIHGNAIKELPKIPEDSIDLAITSPPYWGLRTYNAGDGELGCEPTMERYLDNTLAWVKEVYRVLKPSGSFVLNIGDCFLGGGRGNYNKEEGTTSKLKQANAHTNGSDFVYSAPYFKPKQLLAVSHFAYCKIITETDFVCRGVHIWAKPNVPSPIRSRLKHSHEYLYWFVKDADEYYFDEKPWMKEVLQSTKTRLENIESYNLPDGSGRAVRYVEREEKRSIDEQLRYMRAKARNATSNSGEDDQSATPGKRGCSMSNTDTIEHSWRVVPVGAKQNGFELAGKQASEHVAPYPEELIRPYIKSLAPFLGTVLDPFLGSGTTMRIALEEGRNCTGIELSEKSITYAKKRLNWGLGLGIDYGGNGT